MSHRYLCNEINIEIFNINFKYIIILLYSYLCLQNENNIELAIHQTLKYIEFEKKITFLSVISVQLAHFKVQS